MAALHRIDHVGFWRVAGQHEEPSDSAARSGHRAGWCESYAHAFPKQLDCTRRQVHRSDPRVHRLVGGDRQVQLEDRQSCKAHRFRLGTTGCSGVDRSGSVLLLRTDQLTAADHHGGVWQPLADLQLGWKAAEVKIRRPTAGVAKATLAVGQ